MITLVIPALGRLRQEGQPGLHSETLSQQNKTKILRTFLIDLATFYNFCTKQELWRPFHFKITIVTDCLICIRHYCQK
jgi:hypothetical protein